MKWSKISSVAEIRYKRGYRYLDVAGETAATICKEIPSLSLDTANTIETSLLSDNGLLVCNYGISSAKIRQYFEGNSRILESFNSFFELITNDFGVSEINFLGNRTSYNSFFPKESDADEWIKSFAKKHQVGADFFANSNDDRLKRLDLDSFRLRFSDKNLIIDLKLVSGKRQVNLKGPGVHALIQNIPPIEFFVELDIDIFARQSLTKEQLDVDKFVESNDKMISTRILPLLEL